MKSKVAILHFFILSLLSGSIWAQLPPVRHASAEAKQKSKDRAEYGAFRKEIAALKEFADEKKKIPKLQKENKEVVKVIVTIDSVETDDASIKTLTGYITQQIGDNSTNAFEIIFDRATKKITTVKRTGESADPEPVEAKTKTTAVKKVAPAKKKKEGDEDEEEEDKEEKEEKPAGKEKDE